MASAEVNQLEDYLGLPALRGSSKQVAWARSIRHRGIMRLLEQYPELPLALVQRSVTLGQEQGKALRETDAHWWIENREKRLVVKLAKSFAA